MIAFTDQKKLIKCLQFVFAAEIIFIVVVYVCKIAVSLLLRRPASQRFKRAVITPRDTTALRAQT